MEDIKQIKEQVISRGNIPAHIAIIMDGNGRWAKQRGLLRVAGHREGINSVREIVRICGEIGVKYLTLYTFSTENWRRPRAEVSALMTLLMRTIRKEVADLKKNNVKLSTIGNLADFPPDAAKAMREAMDTLKDCGGLNLCLALSYSGRQEILYAVNSLLKSGASAVDEAGFSRALYTREMPDPDLLIRTSGEMRISNFLLWQLAYTEIHVSPVYWPDFREKQLYLAIADYQKRERRFGRVSEQLNREP